MSNQTGDRYSCSDPNCGCEIEIQRPCNMISSERRVRGCGYGSVSAGFPLRRRVNDGRFRRSGVQG